LTHLRVYRAAWVVLGTVVLAFSLATGDVGNWQAVTLLAVIGVVAEGRSMPVTRDLELSVAFIPVVLAAILFGPGAGGLVALVCMVGDRNTSLGRWMMYAAIRATAGCAAGGAAELLRDATGGTSLLDLLLACVCAALVMSGIDFLANLGHVQIIRSMTPRQLWHLVRASLGLTIALYTPLVALYAYAYESAGMIVLAFFAIPLLAAHLSHSMFRRQRQLIDQLTASNARLEEANRRLRKINLSFAWAMVRTLEARDRYTAGHSQAVAIYARDIAREMGLPQADVDLVHLAGLVHDIGKIGLPAEVLRKKSALTDDEWRAMREHSEIGENILLHVEDYREVASIVRSHHERIDGAGYPDGLQGIQIPLLARVISVADAYNAMTSERPYRGAMAPEVASGQLVNGRGTQFYPEAVEAFLRVLENASDDYRVARGSDFSLDAMQRINLRDAEWRPALRAAVA
jgi:putative nucleotidyltransferase with HDIG domain